MDLDLRMSSRNRCRWLVYRWKMGLSRVISHCPEICPQLKLGFPATQVGYDIILTILTAMEQVITYY